MEIIFRPSVPDNVDHWQVFKDDKQVINFLNNMHEFSDFKIGHKEEGCIFREYDQQINPTLEALFLLSNCLIGMMATKRKEKRIWN